MTDPDNAAALFLEAGDHLATVRDLLELVSMAHRHPADSDAKAVSTGCHMALDQLADAIGKLEALRPALGMENLSTIKQAVGRAKVAA